MIAPETKDFEITTTIRIPSKVAYDQSIVSAIAVGFEKGRNGFIIEVLKSLGKHVDEFGLEDGLKKFKKKLEVK